MISKFKPISISLSPNVQKDDVVLALKLLFQPWKWAGHKPAPAVAQLEKEFAQYLGVKYAISFNSGRSSLYAILKALDLPGGSDVALQAFTCNAVPNPILWAGLNPVYIDCADDFNIDTEKLKAKSYNLKAIVLQHTFGLPAQIPANFDGILIEDCAHALGAEINGQKVGTFGKAAFFSFARDKVISCVYGGMAVTNDDQIGKRLQELQQEFGQPSMFWVKQQLLHPVLLNFFILPLYNFFNAGKALLVASQWLHLLSKAVSWQEKRGLRPDYFPKALPNALAELALNQFHKLEQFNTHRKKIAQYYFEQLKDTKFILPKNEGPGSRSQSDHYRAGIFLRFPVRHTKANEIIYDAWHNHNMLLGDWYRTPVDPFDTKPEAVKYVQGSCPNAESLTKRTLNLPTHINISMNDAKRVVEFLKKYA